MSARPTCVHCKKRVVQRPRGLCWTCYYTPGVRLRYSSGSKYARRGVGNGFLDPPLPAQPTSADPGSEEKIQVLAARAAAGEALFHPKDVRTGPPPKEWTVPVVRGDYQAPGCGGRRGGRQTTTDTNPISDGDMG